MSTLTEDSPVEPDDKRFYVLTGSGELRSDFEGPFTLPEATDHLKSLCGQWASPEMINTAVIVTLSNNVFDLFKDENGNVIDGKRVFWNSHRLLHC